MYSIRTIDFDETRKSCCSAIEDNYVKINDREKLYVNQKCQLLD